MGTKCRRQALLAYFEEHRAACAATDGEELCDVCAQPQVMIIVNRPIGQLVSFIQAGLMFSTGCGRSRTAAWCFVLPDYEISVHVGEGRPSGKHSAMLRHNLKMGAYVRDSTAKPCVRQLALLPRKAPTHLQVIRLQAASAAQLSRTQPIKKKIRWRISMVYSGMASAKYQIQFADI